MGYRQPEGGTTGAEPVVSAEPGLAVALRAADHGVAPGERDTLLRTVLAAIPGVAAGVLAVSLTSWDGRSFRTMVTSDRVAERLDEWQYGADRGPCVDAAREGRRAFVVDLAGESTGFAAAAGRGGAHSVLSVPVPGPPGHHGLNYYASAFTAFDGRLVAAKIDLFGRAVGALLRGSSAKPPRADGRFEAAATRRTELDRACAESAMRHGITVEEVLRAVSARAIRRRITMAEAAREFLGSHIDE